ncbi:hypothetical protein [Paenibacillus dendrobii]|nr:hypothetical protein [Paenibacillus dendrobii]
MSNTVVHGLKAILSGGADFITFEENKPMTLLFIDWHDNLVGVREHYEKSLIPSYIRCPGHKICPLCKKNPGKYPAMRIKFRVYDPLENKIKFISLAKTHIKKLNDDFTLQGVDPTKVLVTIFRKGKGIAETSYKACRYIVDHTGAEPKLAVPSRELMKNLPDILPQITPHSPDEIAGFMQATITGNAGLGDKGNQNPQKHGLFQKLYTPRTCNG